MAFIEQWLRRVSPTELIVVRSDLRDFKDDLEFVKLLQEVNPHCTTRVVFGPGGTVGVPEPIAGSFRSAWRIRFSAADPPPTVLLFVRTADRGVFPLHDRWILSDSSGLRLGTSLKSLGRGRTSEISCLELTEVTGVRDSVEAYLRQSVRDYRGERIVYDLFSL